MSGNDTEARIRARAYEIWERDGRTGNPEDHWLEAEQQIKAEAQVPERSDDRSNATVDEAQPAAAAKAADVLGSEPTKPQRSNK
jgi:hypothetical protein